tara:strand:+ start:499 stop:912 length:414 start_codon:yes stop_codon:yes gene_type:complete
MLQITPQHKLLLAIQPADFRKGIDGLAHICKSKLSNDPFSGTIFAFTNRRRSAVKLLVFDGNGFWLCMKRFSKGVLSWWPSAEAETWELNASQVQVLLMQGDPRLMMTPDEWRKLPSNALSKGIDFNVGHQAATAST